MLQFGIKPHFFHKEFLEKCREQLNISDMETLEKELEERSPVLKEWNRFNSSLRNELARNRAIRKHKDPQQYIKEGIPQDPFVAPFSHWAVSQDSPLDAEYYLDRVRWEKLDELAVGHYFDMGYLIIYSLKLKILERWHIIDSGTGMNLLENLYIRGQKLQP